MKVNTMQKLEIDEIRNFLKSMGEETKVYIGCDSKRFSKKKGEWYARYTTVLVVHMNSKNGCRVFGSVETERDYDQNKKRPSMRLMNEVYKVSQLYVELADILEEFDVEVHLDVNPDEKHGSSCVLTQAIGYVKGVCGVEPKVKPEAFAASYAADRFTRVSA